MLKAQGSSSSSQAMLSIVDVKTISDRRDNWLLKQAIECWLQKSAYEVKNRGAIIRGMSD